MTSDDEHRTSRSVICRRRIANARARRELLVWLVTAVDCVEVGSVDVVELVLAIVIVTGGIERRD